MYGRGGIEPGLGAVIPTAAGIAVLPDTGDNKVLFYVALTSIVIGALIVLTTVIRIVAKKFYKA